MRLSTWRKPIEQGLIVIVVEKRKRGEEKERVDKRNRKKERKKERERV